jgi:hypothetical protein
MYAAYLYILRAFESAARSGLERSPDPEREIADGGWPSAAVSRKQQDILVQTNRHTTEARIDALVKSAQMLERQLAEIEHREPRRIAWTYHRRQRSSIQLS